MPKYSVEQLVALALRGDLGCAQGGVDAVERFGLVNSRYGYYRHDPDARFTWGNFTGQGATTEIVLACASTRENTASKPALVRALLASAVQFKARAGVTVAYLGSVEREHDGGEVPAREALLDALVGLLDPACGTCGEEHGSGYYNHNFVSRTPLLPKRLCYVITPEAAVGDRIRIVVEGESGFRPTPLDRGEPMAILEAKVLTYNARLGISQDEAGKMVMASMFPPREQRGGSASSRSRHAQ